MDHRSLNFMRAFFLALIFLAATSGPVSASGPENATSAFDPNRVDNYERPNQPNRPPQRESRARIAQAPHDLGKAIFSGKYAFQKRKLTAANLAEKANRLFTLKNILPARERGKINPRALAPLLTDREMNALEYYLGVHFGTVIERPPSWAQSEPPIRVAGSR